MLGTILTALVALIHFYFLYLESFAWEAPRTRKVFGTTPDLAAQTKAMAQNQGLYNGFLATGLVFGLWTGNAPMVLFLLVCIILAGIIGWATAVKAALYVQTLPAALALLALFLGL